MGLFVVKHSTFNFKSLSLACLNYTCGHFSMRGIAVDSPQNQMDYGVDLLLLERRFVVCIPQKLKWGLKYGIATTDLVSLLF